MPGWQDAALERLWEKCDYLIEVRGNWCMEPEKFSFF